MHVYGFVKATRTKCKIDFFPEELILGLNLFNLLIYDFLLCFIETQLQKFYRWQMIVSPDKVQAIAVNQNSKLLDAYP